MSWHAPYSTHRGVEAREMHFTKAYRQCLDLAHDLHVPTNERWHRIHLVGIDTRCNLYHCIPVVGEHI